MFLPDDYKAPSNGGSANYVKLKDGENRFRILSMPILGWVDWSPQKQPVRSRLNAKPAKPFDPDRAIKHFWAMLVWDYDGEAIKIWEITQKTIQTALEDLSTSSDWGVPYFYDLKILRSGKDLETSYTVIPVPPKELHPKVEEEFAAKPCWLDALFDSEDPWNMGLHPQKTRGIFKQSDVNPETAQQERELLNQISLLALGQNVDTAKLAMYIGLKAAEKRRTFSEVIQSALMKEFTGSFLSAYQKWFSNQEAVVEEIPF